MRFRTTTLDLLAVEFATAVAEGEMEAAEGWLAMAQHVAAKDPKALERERTKAAARLRLSN